MRVSESGLYRTAYEALERLRAIAQPHDLAAIAQLMLSVKNVEIDSPRFPYVGSQLDDRDRAVVEAYEQSWTRFIEGEDSEFE